MTIKNLLVSLLLCLWILSGCQPAPIAPTATAVVVPPTDIPGPTNTSVPTETPRPANTPLPAGVLFRDDFEDELQPGWEWDGENPAKWSLTGEGALQIIGESNGLLSDNQQNNLLWYPLPAGNVVITVHLKTKPLENFHQAAIFIYEDPENYVTINRGYCDLCSTGGNGFYMDYKIGGEWGDYAVATTADDVYLRLESKDNVISGYYATSPGQWERLGRFGNYFQFKQVGIGVSNIGAASDVVGQFDYFEIGLP
jgi:hypothetical protein